MLFNSVEFLFFLPLVFILYWFVFNKNLKHQNLLILVSSYVFYGWWDYRFLFLILLSTVVDYVIGIKISRQKVDAKRKYLLWCSMFFNLTVLGFFKYYNFFISSWIDLFGSMGYEIQSVWTLNIVLPVGISFYTFQTMSYTIDVYRKQLKPTTDFISFASFVSFFPQLVAGPIERATSLVPQILNKREFNYEKAVQGVRLVVWGMFKKIVIADSLSPIVDQIFSSYTDYSGISLWLGAIFFSFQIYCDFSGYSDIAIGTSKLFGFELMTNFKFPYFSRNIGEFWRRWHISLSTWFRDYLYIPLGGSKHGKLKSIRNIFIIFLVSGLWHGANWTFIAWGLFHGILFLPSFVSSTNRKYKYRVLAENRLYPSFLEITQMLFTFVLVTIGWVFFRSETIVDSFQFINRMFTNFMLPDFLWRDYVHKIVLLLVIEWFIRKKERLDFKFTGRKAFLLELMILSILIATILVYWGRVDTTFIYFQF